MMSFRDIKGWVVDYLGGKATSLGYRVIGYNDSGIDASELRGSNRLVQVFVKSGEFPRQSSAFTGPVTPAVSVAVELLASASASADLSVLDDSGASAAELAAALAASQKAAAMADDSFDELAEIIFQLLMANDQQDLGHEGCVANRWVTGWRKGSPLNRGENVIIPGTIEFGFRCAEELTGVYPVVPTTDSAIRVDINASADTDGTPQEGSAVSAGG
jgi:hypothetical protein